MVDWALLGALRIDESAVAIGLVSTNRQELRDATRPRDEETEIEAILAGFQPALHVFSLTYQSLRMLIDGGVVVAGLLQRW